jgi:hypothetical protein
MSYGFGFAVPHVPLPFFAGFFACSMQNPIGMCCVNLLQPEKVPFVFGLE